MPIDTVIVEETARLFVDFARREAVGPEVEEFLVWVRCKLGAIEWKRNGGENGE